MSEKKVVICNEFVEHGAIAEMVQVACRFNSRITLKSDNKRINAKSIMGIMAFCPSSGMAVDIEVEGSDENEALSAIEDFLICLCP